MSAKVELRKQKISDARRFYEILNNPNFTFFPVRPENVEAEIDFLKNNEVKRRNHFEYNYAILYEDKLVGGCGIKIDQHRPFTGEIGYFLDEAYWSRGIVTQAVRMLERIGFEQLGLNRIEILMNPNNIASKRVAIKCGYQKEGIMRKAIKDGDEFTDAYLYAKVK